MASVGELEQEVGELRKKVDALASIKEHATEAAALLGPFTRQMIEVLRITRELFPGPVAVKLMCDPEVPSDEFVVFVVESEGEPGEIIEREEIWHQRLADLLPDRHEELRLAVDPR